MLNPYTRYISEEKCIVGRRHLACMRELAEGEHSPRFFASRSVWKGLKSAFWILVLGGLAVVFVMEHLVLTPALYT